MSTTKKDLKAEIFRLLEVVLTWRNWTINIRGITKDGNFFEYEAVWPKQ